MYRESLFYMSHQKSKVVSLFSCSLNAGGLTFYLPRALYKRGTCFFVVVVVFFFCRRVAICQSIGFESGNSKGEKKSIFSRI